MRLLEVFSVCILAIACAKSRTPKTAYYFNEIGGTGQAAVDDIASQIEHLSGSRILHDTGGELVIEFSWANLPDDIIGQARGNGFYCQILLDDSLNPDSPSYNPHSNLKLVVMHEIGHCFGLNHSPLRFDVMFWECNPNLQDSPNSIARFIEQLSEARKPK